MDTILSLDLPGFPTDAEMGLPDTVIVEIDDDLRRALEAEAFRRGEAVDSILRQWARKKI